MSEPGKRRLLRRVPRRFVRREDGTVTVFAAIVFILMLAVGGIAVDIMRYETQRTQLQYTLDRAVLAAASLSQTRDPQAVVETYFETAGLADYRLRVQVDEGLNFRRVEAQAEMEIRTLFMSLFGQRVLTSPAAGAAEERIPNVEISLVLDISGSMRFRDGGGMPRITRLRAAARNFVDRLLEGDRADLTTISVVPYAGHVNPGGTVFDLVGGGRSYLEYTNDDDEEVTVLRDHPRSSCVELNTSHFDSGSVPTGGSFTQVPHFMYYPIDNPTMDWGWCPLEGSGPTAASSSIQYFSADADYLNDYIERMRLHDGTGTHFGMLWAVWLLHPDTRWLTAELADRGMVDDGFENRPAPFEDPDTLKVIVLMTDGKITHQFRPRFADRTQSPIEADEDPDVFLNHTRELQRQNNRDDCNNQGCATNVSRNNNVQRFYEACNLAHDNDIVVFTIAFDTDNAGRTEMRNCATADSYYYNVRGADLDSAFQSIAGAIQRLRLVQ